MSTAPVLSTPAEHMFEYSQPETSTEEQLSDEQVHIQYEILRTVDEIRRNGWKRIALQFPDEMLKDAPRVVERLQRDLKVERKRLESSKVAEEDSPSTADAAKEKNGTEERLTILADTSYGSCCVDEIAASHVSADSIVHYGRSCLSPTSRLPVLYIYTSPSLDLDAAIATFTATYPDRTTAVILMADIPYAHHIEPLTTRLRDEHNYTNLHATDIIHNTGSLIPNRTLPASVQQPDDLKPYTLFHISTPPTPLLLTLTSRLSSIHIYPTHPPPTPSTTLPPAQTTPLLRRRYALLSSLPSARILGILINTLSISNYLPALQNLQDLLTSAGKKFYTVVVGKLNPAKLANFAEVDCWVVVGCWESAVVGEEGGREFYKPVLTPFEVEVGLGVGGKGWSGEWVGGFGGLIGADSAETKIAAETDEQPEQNEDDDEDAPPEYDLRTGRYVASTTPRRTPTSTTSSSTTLTTRPKGTLAAPNTINGALSPAANFLHEKRTWQGLGSDKEVIAYERDEEGNIRGAGMEVGRGGVARGMLLMGRERGLGGDVVACRWK